MALFRSVLTLLVLFLGLVSFASGRDRNGRSSGNTTRQFEIRFTWEDWAPAGIPRKMILANGQYPGPLLELNQGDDVELFVINDLPFSTTVHFHGIEQHGTPWSDGTPGMAQKPIAPGETFLYKWRATDYGSYFYHAHHRGQLEDGLYGAIYIHSDDSIEKPFSLIAADLHDLQAMQAAEDATTPILLSDVRQLTSEELWAAEESSGYDAYCANAVLVNGKGSVSCLGQQTLDKYTTPTQRRILGNQSLSDIGCVPPTNFLTQGAYPHNPSAVPSSVFYGCTPSHGATEKFLADPQATYVSYDLISAAGILTFAFSIDEHRMYVYAIDGQYIVPTLADAINIAGGVRYSVLVKLDKPAGDYTIRVANTDVSQIISGTALMTYSPAIKTQSKPSVPSIDITGTLTSNRYTFLDESTIIPYTSQTVSQEVTETYVLTIGRYNSSYSWTLGNSSFPLSLEETAPLLFHPSAAENDLTIKTLNGTWIDLIFHVTDVGTLEPPHPIHKHSNKFFVIGQGTGDWNYSSVSEAMNYIPESFNLKNPQLRDTYPTPAADGTASWLAIRYQVVNPGAFLLHCHIQVHFSGGMGLAILDGIDEWPEIPEEYRQVESGSSKSTGLR